ncbi:MAG: preprotein translocase subunit SecG [Gammaproteobacteria bacterium]|nr:preprotein translocase subunit SecG [Gammaproteobacteria bacterium]MCY3940895.1 preprotein translocase subunit SecG [Gammaproteobacteria bacterium]MDE0489075.1 preprotein translocase subunit SecG [Gammaproteobacteria bacterium]MDE0681160.1 preprotein translocase subunit SecG [Gammaproteobacteria bacterium]MXW45662.1 preprotein translocase subunit SecG [Gammaproteobacteria bacterium]
MLQQLFLAAHVLVAALIIVFVLLQRGKGAETGAAFGSGASGTVFGARGSANFLSRVTAVLATLFFATSLILTGVGKPRPEESLLDTIEQAAPAEEEAVPEEEDEDLPQLPSLQPAEQPDIPQE